MKFTKLLLIVLLALLVACGSKAQNTVQPVVVTTSKPTETIVQIVDDGDSDKDVHTVSRGGIGFDDVYIEQGMADAQILCSVKQNISVGSASLLNAVEYTIAQCPELLTGVEIQIVNTQTSIVFDCGNCTISFSSGNWEIGKGVKVWRGIITIKPTSEKMPDLVLYPLNQP